MRARRLKAKRPENWKDVQGRVEPKERIFTWNEASLCFGLLLSSSDKRGNYHQLEGVRRRTIDSEVHKSGPLNWKFGTPQHMCPIEPHQRLNFDSCAGYVLPCLIEDHCGNLYCCALIQWTEDSYS